jgi:ABC-type transport system involved in cytochrome c biogenesis permease component
MLALYTVAACTSQLQQSAITVFTYLGMKGAIDGATAGSSISSSSRSATALEVVRGTTLVGVVSVPLAAPSAASTAAAADGAAAIAVCSTV